MAEDFQVDDLGDAVDALATGIYLVTRAGATTYTQGRPVAAASSSLEIRAMVYPVTGRTLDRLPEGLRTHETIAVVTRTELKSLQATKTPDLVTYKGAQYQVAMLEDWKASGGFWRAFCTRVPSA